MRLVQLLLTLWGADGDGEDYFDEGNYAQAVRSIAEVLPSMGRISAGVVNAIAIEHKIDFNGFDKPRHNRSDWKRFLNAVFMHVARFHTSKKFKGYITGIKKAAEGRLKEKRKAAKVRAPKIPDTVSWDDAWDLLEFVCQYMDRRSRAFADQDDLDVDEESFCSVVDPTSRYAICIDGYFRCQGSAQSRRQQSDNRVWCSTCKGHAISRINPYQASLVCSVPSRRRLKLTTTYSRRAAATRASRRGLLTCVKSAGWRCIRCGRVSVPSR